MPSPQALFLALLFLPLSALAQEESTEATSSESTASEALSESTPALTRSQRSGFSPGVPGKRSSQRTTLCGFRQRTAGSFRRAIGPSR